MKVEPLQRVELIAGIALSLAVLFLLLVRTTHAGALWRDECGALQLARMPTFADIAANFQHEAFPLLFPATVRAYTNVFGTSDLILRCFGLALGIGFLGIVWFNSRLLGFETPLVSLALIGLNTTFLTSGNSIRAYGAGSLFLLLGVALTAKFLVNATPRGITAVGLAFLASVQFLINDVPLVGAVIVAAAVICFIRGRKKEAFILLGIGAICALSLVPYVKGYAGADWNIVLRYHGQLERLWHEFNLALENPISVLPWLWYILFAGSIAGATWRLRVLWQEKPTPEWDLLLFGSLVAVLSVASYYAFLRFLRYLTQPWYFLPLICVIAASLDLLIAHLSRIRWVRLGRLALALAALLVLPFAAWPKIIERQTNVDLAARALEQNARPDDLIVVNPCHLGVGFNWYYHGSAPWITVPLIEEHRTHRYDLVRAKMTQSDPLADVNAAIKRTLQSGNRVWVVGGAHLLGEGEAPMRLPPAPHSIFGWSEIAYLNSWSEQLAANIQKHAVRSEMAVYKGSHVSTEENVPVWVLSGWRD